MSYPLDTTYPSHFSQQREFKNEKTKTEEEEQKKIQRLVDTNKAMTTKKKCCYTTGLETKQEEQHDKSLRHEQKEQKNSKHRFSKLAPENSTGQQFIQGHGSRIFRAVGKKDRHSKVCTSKGPRDRRVRLSPTTAIQLYDVQDRLGYDRPSKALDWLIDKAKTSIEALSHDLTNETDHYVNIKSSVLETKGDLKEHTKGCVNVGKTTTRLNSRYSLDQDNQTLISNMIPFPAGTCASSSSSSHFKDYSTQDLHSASGLLDLNVNDMDFYQNLSAWNICIAGNGRQGLFFNSLPESFEKQVVNQSQLSISSQREPLQSRNLFPLHDWVNPAISRPPFFIDGQNLYGQLSTSHSISGPTFSSDGLIGRKSSGTIQGEEQKHSAAPNKGSSACSSSQIYYS